MQSGNNDRGRGSRGKLWRRVHALVGIVSSVNLLVLIGSGLLLQHASLLRLDEKTITRAILPKSYRQQDGDSGVRADVFVTDLHSGRLLGTTGTVVVDVLTLGWLTLLLTGVVMYAGKPRAKTTGTEKENGLEGLR
jgi:hypothetical protein